MSAQGGDGAFQVHGVPEDDGGDDQVKAAGAIALVLEAAVAQVALPVEEDRTGESVPSFAFVEADLNTPSQLGVFHPLQHEKRPLDAADFAQRGVEAVLARIAGQLADDERGRHRAVPDGRCESQNLFPLRSDQFQIQLAPDQRSERRVVALLSWHIKPLVGEIPDAGRKAKAQQVAERKDMIGKAGRVGVVLLDPQIGLMVEQTIENMRRIAGIRGNHLGIEGRVLVGDMGVKEHAWLVAIAQIDLPGLLSAPAGAEALAVRRRCRTFAPVLGEWVLMMMVDQFGKSLRVRLHPGYAEMQASRACGQ